MTEHTPQDEPTGEAADQAKESDGQAQESDGQAQESDGQSEQRRVVVVTQDGMGVASPEGADADSESAESKQRKPTELVEQPAKVMRLGTMIKQLLEEVKDAPLDEAGRARLAEIHRRSLTELEQGLAPELVEELERITLPLADGTPSEAELRIAQAQLVGWLEGLFHGIQTAIVAQQMAAQQQLQQIRLGLPGGAGGRPDAGMIPGQAPGQPPRQPGSPDSSDDDQPTGQYL